MNKIALSGIVAAAGLSASALAQPTYEFGFQLVPDTTAGGINFPIGNPGNVTATRVAFWLQARVQSTGGTNWGIARVSAPAVPDTSLITLSGGGATLARGTVNAAGTSHGRGPGFRQGGGANGGATGSVGGDPFPGATGNNNGALDSGNTRIYGYEAYVGAIRETPRFDNDGEQEFIIDPVTGQPINPWNINGANTTATVGNPVPNQPLPAGVWSPWANIYRIWVDITDFSTERDIVLSAHALVNAGQATADTGGSQAGTGQWPMSLSPGQLLDASFTMHIVPTPGAAAVLGLGGLLAARRRR